MIIKIIFAELCVKARYAHVSKAWPSAVLLTNDHARLFIHGTMQRTVRRFACSLEHPDKAMANDCELGR